MRKIYAIGVGGSGAKCLEAAVFAHSLGIFGDSQLGILLVDADASNGNSQRTGINFRTTLTAYNSFEKGKSPFMSGAFKDYGSWNPLADQTHSSNLRNIFNRQSLKGNLPSLAKLFDALYSPAEQTADLGVGFRGRPPIGSAVMSRLELDDLIDSKNSRNWQQMFNDIQTDRGQGDDVSIHFFGSIFGGTGASGVPTLAKIISKQLLAENLRGNVHINASLLLPYFGFEKPSNEDKTVYAETRLFALNTQAALQYLTEQAQESFDSVYLIGNQDPTLYPSSTGGTSQQNNAHFVELYAALAINHGFEQPVGQTQALYISRANPERLTWDDLPESTMVKKALGKGSRFAYAWFYNFSLEIQAARTLGSRRFSKGAPWFKRFFALRGGSDEKPDVSAEDQVNREKALTAWCQKYLLWVSQVSTAARQGTQLFKLENVPELTQSPDNPRPYHEHLAELVIDGAISNETRQRDRLDEYKNRIADHSQQDDPGVFGLAHALFNVL